MNEDKDVHIQVYSESDGHSIQVLNPDGDRVFFGEYWNHNDVDRGVRGEGNFIEILKYLGYIVYHEEVY